MKALILAAGYGTRLRSIAENTPKPLLPINDKPLINYIIDRIQSLNGLTEIIVISNNKFYDIFLQWAKKQKTKVPIKIINDGTNVPEERLGSIGDIAFALKDAKINDDILVVGGDNLFDYNIDQYIEFSRSKTGCVTLGLYDIGDITQAHLFGVVELDQQSKVRSFEEKPQKPKSTLIAMCCYYFPKSTLDLVHRYLSEIKKSDTAGDYIRWLHEKSNVYGFKFTGKWYDIGSVESYYEAQKMFK